MDTSIFAISEKNVTTFVEKLPTERVEHRVHLYASSVLFLALTRICSERYGEVYHFPEVFTLRNYSLSLGLPSYFPASGRARCTLDIADDKREKKKRRNSSYVKDA